MNQNEKLDFVISEITYVRGLLENNPKTGQIGVVKRLDELELSVAEILVKDRIRMGKAGIVGGLITALLLWIGKLVLKLMF